mmetsp:Transcript_32424/g.82606  ORF Transcript_32424/g.82606 Transcript_32424/m.82606 type:complete len:259 (-) Transcript_32424:639-1415(-)
MLLHRPLLFLQVGKHIVLHLVGELGDGQLDEGQHGARVARADLVELLAELLVADSAGAVLVQEPEHALELVLLDVHQGEQLAEGSDVLVGVDQLLKADLARTIRIHLLTEAIQLLLVLLLLQLFLPQLVLSVLVAGVLGSLHDHREDQVHEAQGDSDHDGDQNAGRPGLRHDHRHRDQAPAVARHHLLEERQRGLTDRREASVAPIAAWVAQLRVDGVDVLHEHDRPDHQQGAQHNGGEEQGLHDAHQTADQQVELAE